MDHSYKRKVDDERDDWEDCKFTNLRKGDVFYIMEGNQEGPFLTALSNVELRPSSKDETKIIWHLETEPMSDDNFL